MALSPVVSEIFNVEKCGDIEIGVTGHSKSLKEEEEEEKFISSKQVQYRHTICIQTPKL